eukprot:gene3566-biopygen19
MDSTKKEIPGDGACNELLALANTQREESRLELANFVLGKPANALNELIATTWKMSNLLEKGRGKFRNIMITGLANCGKTDLLNPLNDLFETFTNPANTSYAWLGAEKAQVILLNDFLYSTEIMAWNDFLCFLEGQTVHLAAPKSTYAQDIHFNKDTPAFATGKEKIKFLGRYNMTDE